MITKEGIEEKIRSLVTTINKCKIDLNLTMKVRDCGFNENDFEDLELIHEDKVKSEKPRQTRRTHFCVEETPDPTNISYHFISIF